jgi:hypothetical protein
VKVAEETSEQPVSEGNQRFFSVVFRQSRKFLAHPTSSMEIHRAVTLSAHSGADSKIASKSGELLFPL